MKKGIEGKRLGLEAVIRSYGSVLAAFSGGCDSALVVRLARDLLGRGRLKAVTARSESLPESEVEEVNAFTQRFDIDHVWIETRELENPSYASNPLNRCYFCKTELYDHLLALAREWGLQVVANGVNQDDLGDWRPGIGAAKEYGVRSPLLEAGLVKAEIREISRRLGLPTWDKPAAACLASRIPFGERVTREKLRQIDQGEAVLKACGFRVVRLRHLGGLARIEVARGELDRFSQSDLREEIFSKIKALGFEAVTLDPEGYRQGKLHPTQKAQAPL